MKTESLDGVLNYVMPDVPGCPRSLAIREILEAAIGLCEYSRIWEQEMDRLGILKDVADYELELPQDASVCSVSSVRVNGRRLTARTIDYLNSRDPGWRDAEGAAESYVMEDQSTIRLSKLPKEDIADALAVTFTLKPSRSATTIPQLLYNDWLPTIADGARSKLLALPGKAWTNQARSDSLSRQFKAGKISARIEAMKGHGTGDMTVQRRQIISRRGR